MSAEKIELNWIHKFLKFSNWIFSLFVISLHWFSFAFCIPTPQHYIESIQANGFQILNLKIRKALRREDSSRQFLHIAITLINLTLYIKIYQRDGFYVERNFNRFPRGLE